MTAGELKVALNRVDDDAPILVRSMRRDGEQMTCSPNIAYRYQKPGRAQTFILDGYDGDENLREERKT